MADFDMQAAYIPEKKTNNIGYDLASEKERIALGIEELKKEIKERWQKKYGNSPIFPAQIEAMNPAVVDFLLSFSLVSVYDNIAKQAGLDVKGRSELPHIVWEIASTKNWDSLDQILKARLNLQEAVHVTVCSLLETNIISKIKSLPQLQSLLKAYSLKDEENKIVSILFAEALSKYPNLGEQSVTMNQLKLKYFPTPVRPSIKNWITDYHDNMGAGKHSPIDRGNYLFHSDNGKKLTSGERQKLSIILKSLDEQLPVSIDSIAQQIVFDAGKDVEALPTEKVDINPIRSIQSDKIIDLSQKPKEKSFFAEDKSLDNDYFSNQRSAAPAAVLPEDDDVFARFAPKGLGEQIKYKERIAAPVYVQKSPEAVAEKKPVQSPNFLQAFSENNGQQNSPQIIKKEIVNGDLRGSISFSSPQKFSAEIKTENVVSEKSSQGQKNMSGNIGTASYSIKPRNYFDD